MAEVEAASAAPGEKRSAGRPRKEAAPPALLRGSESGDPSVHQLIADMYTAQQNVYKDAERAAADALADLGFE